MSQQARVQRYIAYKNIFLMGSENPDTAALYNKTFAYIDDLESLLYSPVSLRFHIGEYDTPNTLDTTKFRVASSHLHAEVRRSNFDQMISDAVQWSLVKGKAMIKLKWGANGLVPLIVQPELMGVLQENRNVIDSDMEAFVHVTYITPYQFNRLIWDRGERERAILLKKAKKYMRPPKGDEPGEAQAMKQVIIGGLYPFQPAGANPSGNASRGLVEWMASPQPELSPNLVQNIMRLDELWVWNDDQNDWATFQMIGDDMLITNEDFVTNSLAYNPATGRKFDALKGHHPFVEFCPNKLDNYFWGRSEIINIALLQEALNSRINGINFMLRLQENPPKKFRGVAGVNQNVLAKLSKPGGHWNDSNQNANVENMSPEISESLWLSLHEYERMFDEMAGLPPIAKGRGESGVRSQGHAETLVRMFSPRFKDRALIIERNVETGGGLALDLCRAHLPDKMTAWVSPQDAGMEADKDTNVINLPPVQGQVPVRFTFADLPENIRVTIDSHSSSPAFAMEARGLAFDLLKVGALDPEQLIDHVDAPNPEELIAGIERRAAQRAAQLAQHPEEAAKMGKKKR